MDRYVEFIQQIKLLQIISGAIVGNIIGIFFIGNYESKLYGSFILVGVIIIVDCIFYFMLKKNREQIEGEERTGIIYKYDKFISTSLSIIISFEIMKYYEL